MRDLVFLALSGCVLPRRRVDGAWLRARPATRVDGRPRGRLVSAENVIELRARRRRAGVSCRAPRAREAGMTLVLEAPSSPSSGDRVRRCVPRLALPGAVAVSAVNWLQLAVLVAAILVTTPLLGTYLAGVFGGGPARRPSLPAGRAVDLPAGGRRSRAGAAVARVRAVGDRLQRRLRRRPVRAPAGAGEPSTNPTDVVGVPAALAFNTAASFVTNTNWQNYGGESTMSHLTQMAGLTVQNFASAAVGIAVAVALIRGFTRRRSTTIGNFGRPDAGDDTRPRAAGHRDRARARRRRRRPTLRGAADATTVAGATQTIYRGPIASQEAIKELARTAAGSSTRTRRTRSRT